MFSMHLQVNRNKAREGGGIVAWNATESTTIVGCEVVIKMYD